MGYLEGGGDFRRADFSSLQKRENGTIGHSLLQFHGGGDAASYSVW